MKKPTTADIEHLLIEIILPFYELERDLPLPIPSNRNETDAEHSWSLALLACCLAPQIDPRLDVGKVCQYAVLHDMTERYAGDTSVFDPDDYIASKSERERKALQKIQADFKHFPWFTKMLTQYEAQQDAEAQFVKAVDKVIALVIDYLTQGSYYRDRKFTKEYFLKQMAVVRTKATVHAGALRYWDEVYEKILATPGFFYRED